MAKTGILAYGPLIREPGTEIDPLIVERIPTTTPFAVEFGRFSRTRGGAPTVVPYSSGNPVKAEVLVLAGAVALGDAKSLLWRRETRTEHSGEIYRESNSPNAIVVRDEPGFCEVDHVLYTDFNASGKLNNPDPSALASAAINSVAKAPLGKDGISYLIDLIDAGVETALTRRYVNQILVLSGAATLNEALDMLRGQPTDKRSNLT